MIHKDAWTVLEDNTPFLLTAREAADISGVHLNTIYKWIKDGRLKAHKAANNPHCMPRAWRIRYEDLQFLGERDA